ncbi:MAG TPA: hypothetical protein VI977_01600 [archaeon]|nr:hypothetical protein [archaeon]
MGIGKDSRGQAFDVYRLLIGALIGIAILVIVVSIINYLETWKFEVSQRQLFEGLDKAVQTPNGEVVIEKNLTLRQGAFFSAEGFVENSGLQPGCVEIRAASLSAFELQGTSFLKMKSNLLVTVYYQCLRNQPDCETFCIVSFEKELKKP